MLQRRAATTVLLFSLLTACSSTGSRLQGAPVQVDELVTWIEKVHIEATRSRDAISEGYERLRDLASGNYRSGDVAQAYAQFVQAIDVAEQQSKRFHEVVEPMESSAKPVFEQWEQDVATIGNERLRTRSQLRMAVTRERYDALLESATTSRDQLDAFVQSLRDHATFLAHDLNPGSLDEIQEDVKIVQTSAQKLDQELDRCLAAARAYVDNSALPALGTPAGPDR